LRAREEAPRILQQGWSCTASVSLVQAYRQGRRRRDGEAGAEGDRARTGWPRRWDGRWWARGPVTEEPFLSAANWPATPVWNRGKGWRPVTWELVGVGESAWVPIGLSGHGPW